MVAVEQQQGRPFARGERLGQPAQLLVGMADVIEVVLQFAPGLAGDPGRHRDGVALGRIGRFDVIGAVCLETDREDELRRSAVLELIEDLVGHRAVGHVLAVVRRIGGKRRLGDEAVEAQRAEGLAAVPEARVVAVDRQRLVAVCAQAAHQAGHHLRAHLQVGELELVEIAQREPGEHLELGTDGAAAEGGHAQRAARALRGQAVQVRGEVGAGIAAQDGRIEEGLALHHDDVRTLADARLLQPLAHGRRGFADQRGGGARVGLGTARGVLQAVHHQRALQAGMLHRAARRPRFQPQPVAVVERTPERQAGDQADQREGACATGQKARQARSRRQQRRFAAPERDDHSQRGERGQIRPKPARQIAE